LDFVAHVFETQKAQKIMYSFALSGGICNPTLKLIKGFVIRKNGAPKENNIRKYFGFQILIIHWGGIIPLRGMRSLRLVTNPA